MVELRSKRKSLETVTPPTKKRANSVRKSGKGADGKVQQELASVEQEVKEPDKGVDASEAMGEDKASSEQKAQNGGNGVHMEDANKPQATETKTAPGPQSEMPTSAYEAPKPEPQVQPTSTQTQEPAKKETAEARDQSPKTNASASAPAETQKPQTSAASSSQAQRQLLEKGLIYFFYKPKVSVEGEAESVDDVQRSFLVLKPLKGHLKKEPVSAGGARLIALPKKTLPTPMNHGRNLTFVTKANASMEDIRGELHSLQYETATMGSRENPSGRPIGEGAYAILRVGRTSHLVYELTIPKELTNLHKDFGLTHHGSFAASVKNPDAPSPPQARLPEKAEYPASLMDKFQGRRWNALEPEFLDHVNCAMLLIGEHAPEGNISELDQLEHEDEVRAEKLDNSVFEDLKLGADFHDQTTSSWPQ